jgi:aspartyl protease family protein
VKRAKTYKLIRRHQMLLTRATFGGEKRRKVDVRLLVDTGSTFTILPIEAVERLGYDLQHPIRKERLTAASGIIWAPVIQLSWFNCLGVTLKNFQVLVYTFPPGILTDGLLGMDFLTQSKAVISIADAKIRCQSP